MTAKRRIRIRSRLGVEKLETRDQPTAGPFTIVAIPDTQHYVQYANLTWIFDAQTQWIVDHRVSDNIVFVTHLGDIVQNGASGTTQNALEWQRADAAMDRLDGNLALNTNGLVAYSVANGNHDYNTVSDRASGSTRYLEYFGPQRYQGRTWYGGSYLGKNHYQFFEGGGFRFLNINLEWEAPDDVLDWARYVIRANAGLPTIISSHSYVSDSPEARRVIRQSADGNSGESIFRELIFNNPQIFMVINGHFHSDPELGGEVHQVSYNAMGLPVLEMLSDYQERPGLDDGFMRLIRVDPDAHQVQVKTYSPSQNLYETDANSQFNINIDFSTRFRNASPDPVMVSVFQEGVDHGGGFYFGTHDTQLRQATPTTPLGNDMGDLLVDYADANNASQVLLRFDNIFGVGPNQIPFGSRILSATLTLDSNNPGAGGRLHRMRIPWSEQSTWNSLGNGVQTDGIEAQAGYDSQAGVASLTPVIPALAGLSVNVTADIAAWASIERSRGWVILPWQNGTDGWGFSPSEAANPYDRPKLRVEWLPASSSTKVSSFQQGVFGYNGQVDTELSQLTPITPGADLPAMFVDGPNPDDARHVLLRFESIFGSGAGQVPAKSRIESAYLYLTTPYTNSNAPGGGAMFFRVRQPWDNSTTWAGAFGGDGVQSDGIEAFTRLEWNTGSAEFGVVRIDVTASIKLWQRGGANLGWVLLPNNTNGWQIASAENEIVANRPKLIVRWTPVTMRH